MFTLRCSLLLLVCALSRGVLGVNNPESAEGPFPGLFYQTDGRGPDHQAPFVAVEDAEGDDVTTSELGPLVDDVLWVAIQLQGQNGEDEEEEDEIDGEDLMSSSNDEELETNLARRKRSPEQEQEQETNLETARPKRNSQPKSKPPTRWVTVRRSNFVPRLGKRADEETEDVDWAAPSGDQDLRQLAAEVEGAEAPSGDRHLRGRFSFSPRLGRSSFIPRLGRSDPGMEDPSDVSALLDDEDQSISTSAGSFSPLMGKKASFVPRLGKRGRSFAPRLGKRGRSFAPRLGKRGRSFSPRLGKRANPFVPRLGKRGSRAFSPRLGRSSLTPRLGRGAFSPRLGRSPFIPRLGRSDPEMSSLQWST